jgi:hypothetical protein
MIPGAFVIVGMVVVVGMIVVVVVGMIVVMVVAAPEGVAQGGKPHTQTASPDAA